MTAPNPPLREPLQTFAEMCAASARLCDYRGSDQSIVLKLSADIVRLRSEWIAQEFSITKELNKLRAELAEAVRLLYELSAGANCPECLGDNIDGELQHADECSLGQWLVAHRQPPSGQAAQEKTT